MIDYIRGTIVEREVDAIILESNEIGYRVYCANPFAFENETLVYIFDHWREDGRTMYGFLNRMEQKLFRRLLDVNGIGPKSAITILASTSTRSLVLAIIKEDINALSKLPGIGRKTAQRMILDIKDGLAERISGQQGLPSDWNFEFTDSNSSKSSTIAAAVATATNGMPLPWIEAKEALIGLGYTEAELSKLWTTLKTKFTDIDAVKTEQWIKAALQQFAIR